MKILAAKLEDFSHSFARWAGSSHGFLTGGTTIVVWIAFGYMSHFSTGWENALQIYISVVTFLMVFLIQRAQNKGLTAVQLKLNELIASTNKADNSLITAEELSEEELSDRHQSHKAKAAQDEQNEIKDSSTDR